VTDRNLQIKFSENLCETTRPLVTNHLSCDLIMDIDCLRNFSYKENEDVAYVNGKRIDLIRPHSQQQSARLYSGGTENSRFAPVCAGLRRFAPVCAGPFSKFLYKENYDFVLQN
jgi:hypothetical protein